MRMFLLSLLLLTILSSSWGSLAEGEEKQVFDLVGLTFGHDSKAGVLSVGAANGQYEILANRQSHLSCEINRIDAQGIGSEPKLVESVEHFQIDSRYQQLGSLLKFADSSLRAGLVSTDGEFLALLATKEAGRSETILALGHRRGIDAPGRLSGEYQLRGFYISLPNAAACVADNRRGTLSFGDDKRWRLTTHVHRAAWDFKEPRFAEVPATPQTAQGTYQVKVDGHVSLVGSNATWKGFAAKRGTLLVLTESNSQGCGLMLAAKASQRPTDAKMKTTHNLLGASLEFEGTRHLAPVLVHGKITYTPERHAFDASMEKLKWPGFPRLHSFARETLAIRPKESHRLADNGTFGPSGDGTDWHLFLPELGLSIYMMDFDIFAAGRAESVRGMLIGLGGE